MFLFIDALILGTLFAAARSGFRRGFVSFATDLVGFTAALLLSLRFWRAPATAFGWIGFSDGWASLAGGLVIFVPLILLVAVMGWRAGRVALRPGLYSTNKLLGLGFGLAFSTAVLTFGLLATQAAPVPLGLSDAVRRAPIGRAMLSASSPAVELLQPVADEGAERFVLYLRQSLRFVDRDAPEATEPPPMFFDAASPDQLSEAAEAEQELLRLVNEERAAENLEPLAWDDRLARVGRAHSRDMYLTGRFAHTASDGSTPAERVERDGIDYVVTAENLALAPSVTLAHDGLMRSPGHRRNILDPEQTRLGIGAIAGPDGLMVTQTFCGGC